MSVIPQTSRWVDFFRLYYDLPALWKFTEDSYKNKRMKRIAYDKLLECYQKIDPEGNIDSMRRRITGIRTCFRREQRKVEASEQTAKDSSDIYIPHLWYYNELHFLRAYDNKAPQRRVKNTSWNDEENDNEEDSPMQEFNEESRDMSEIETKFQIGSEELSQSHTYQEHPISPRELPQLPQLTQTNQSYKVGGRDEAEVYAEGWAISYRKLDEHNKLLAKKAIEEILILGQMNKLEFNSVKMPN